MIEIFLGVIVVVETIALISYDRLLRQSIRNTDSALDTARKWRAEAMKTRGN